MDFCYLVESGKYNPEDIKDDYNKGILKGFEFALTEIENYFDCEYGWDVCRTIREKMQQEDAAAELASIKQWMHFGKCEMIVSMLDHEFADAQEELCDSPA